MATKKAFFIILGLILFSSIFAQERGVKVVARSGSGEIIELYKECYALIIGVSDYIAGWPDLPKATVDAKEVGDLFVNLGFQVSTAMNPTKTQLIEALEKFVYGPGKDSHQQ